jgi:feruloyl esterase
MQACEKLKDLRLGHAQVVAADYKSSGPEISFKTALLGIFWFDVPASCRVKIVDAPTSDSHIEMEVWMPAESWNQRLWSGGNGGLAGSIDELSMTIALSRGYATSGTDTGHIAADTDGSWALGHPQKLIDYGYRSIHETAVMAKAVMQAFYGKQPSYSYFSSGSNGGREALQEAQRYPDDYIGIEVGAPAFNGTNNIVAGSWIEQRLRASKDSWFSPAKLPAIAAAAMDKCDALDGLKDGLIDDPRRCHVDPDALLCKGAENDGCLTAPQVESLKAIYEGPGGKDPAGYPYYGYAPGGETLWDTWQLGSEPDKAFLYRFALEFHRYLIYGNPNWTLDKFKLQSDREETFRRMGPFYDATNPDLSRFAARGGKLILFHGWADMALQPNLTIDYYERVRSRIGAQTADKFIMLYMVPGMAHVTAGYGPNAFGQMMAPTPNATPATNIGSALEDWVEKDAKPGPIVAAKYSSDIKALIASDGMTPTRTRPLCPYPQVEHWSGKGSIDDAKNFTCVNP